MVIHCKFNYRTDSSGNVFSDWATVSDNLPYSDMDLTVDDIEIDYLDFSAQIHCHDADNKHYTLYQRNIHSFIDQHDA